MLPPRPRGIRNDRRRLRVTVSGSSDPARGAAVRHVQRAGGQVAALGGMIAARRPFAEVAQQLLAARGSLDSLLVRLVEIELDDCLPAAATRGEVDELLRTALGRSAPARATRRQPRARHGSSRTPIGGPTPP
ncbi:MAG: metal-sensitive transcriptional regulator [Chloroflexi bacterium]|nr:metal-sensitive transcriptional regulator [Chloroflexota bacterium]